MRVCACSCVYVCMHASMCVRMCISYFFLIIKVHLAGQKGRGIYLRERHQIEKLTRATIVIQPMFPKKASMCTCDVHTFFIYLRI